MQYLKVLFFWYFRNSEKISYKFRNKDTHRRCWFCVVWLVFAVFFFKRICLPLWSIKFRVFIVFCVMWIISVWIILGAVESSYLNLVCIMG